MGIRRLLIWNQSGLLVFSGTREPRVDGTNKKEEDSQCRASEPHQTYTSNTVNNKGDGDEVGDRTDDAVNCIDEQNGLRIETESAVDLRTVAEFFVVSHITKMN